MAKNQEIFQKTASILTSLLPHMGRQIHLNATRLFRNRLNVNANRNVNAFYKTLTTSLF